MPKIFKQRQLSNKSFNLLFYSEKIQIKSWSWAPSAKQCWTAQQQSLPLYQDSPRSMYCQPGPASFLVDWPVQFSTRFLNSMISTMSSGRWSSFKSHLRSLAPSPTHRFIPAVKLDADQTLSKLSNWAEVEMLFKTPDVWFYRITLWTALSVWFKFCSQSFPWKTSILSPDSAIISYAAEEVVVNAMNSHTPPR